MLPKTRTRKKKVGILGAGAWGTAMARVLAEKGHAVQVWSFEKDVADQIDRDHVNDRYLKGVSLPPAVKAFTDPLQVAADKDVLILAVPSLFLLGVVKRILVLPDIMEGRTPIGVLTKGFIETQGGIKLITDAVEDYLPGIYKGALAYISGPSHAEEVATGKITGLISACRSGTNSIRFRELLTGGNLVVFSSLDVRGVQISAAVKNVIAIAFGMLDALKESTARFGDNTESLLLAAGLNEIQSLGLAMGATHPETFTSIAGVGDLDVTCRSIHGRNRRLGREIVLQGLLSRYSSIQDVIEALPTFEHVAEGVVAAKFVHRLAALHGLSLPICEGVYRVLNRDVEPLKVVDGILTGISRSGARAP